MRNFSRVGHGVPNICLDLLNLWHSKAALSWAGRIID